MPTGIDGRIANWGRFFKVGDGYCLGLGGQLAGQPNRRRSVMMPQSVRTSELTDLARALSGRRPSGGRTCELIPPIAALNAK